MQIDLLFGMDVVFHGLVVIQMLFVDVQKYSHMGGYMDILQLMAGKFTDDSGICLNFFQNIKGRDSDVARQYRVPAAFL